MGVVVFGCLFGSGDSMFYVLGDLVFEAILGNLRLFVSRCQSGFMSKPSVSRVASIGHRCI